MLIELRYADGELMVGGFDLYDETRGSEKQSLQKIIDGDGDNRIEDSEILKAIDYWIKGQRIPGADGQAITDEEILALIDMWIKGSPISTSSAKSKTPRVEPLGVKNIHLTPNPMKSTHIATFRAEGSGIASLKVEVFNLTGMRVFEQEAAGNTLRFYALDDRGRPLANGVYLYVVRVRGYDGREYVSEIRKLVIVR
ncbi:MAG: hypothetical protein QXW98_07825 [Candidatus Caldarchaeum sp.]